MRFHSSLLTFRMARPCTSQIKVCYPSLYNSYRTCRHRNLASDNVVTYVAHGRKKAPGVSGMSISERCDRLRLVSTNYCSMQTFGLRQRKCARTCTRKDSLWYRNHAFDGRFRYVELICGSVVRCNGHRWFHLLARAVALNGI